MIVVNTLTGAVSEYSAHEFHSITPTHAGNATGLFAFGGDSDDGRPIVATLRMPATLREGTLKQAMQTVYLAMRGQGKAQFLVYGPNGQPWVYPFVLRDSEVSRCDPGRGIRENYFGFGLCTPEGQAFSLDRIEVLTAKSKTRRV